MRQKQHNLQLRQLVHWWSAHQLPTDTSWACIPKRLHLFLYTSTSYATQIPSCVAARRHQPQIPPLQVALIADTPGRLAPTRQGGSTPPVWVWDRQHTTGSDTAWARPWAHLAQLEGGHEGGQAAVAQAPLLEG